MHSQDFKTENDLQRSRNYSYPSYISIGTNNLDNIDTTWSQGSDFATTNANDNGTKDALVKGAQKGPSRGKQLQGKQSTSKALTSKQSSQSKQTLSKQVNSKQINTKQTVNRQTSGKQAQVKKTQSAAVVNKARNLVNSKKQLLSASNKRKATTEPAIAVKNAKIKKKDNKKQATKNVVSVQDFRRRSTNSMRLRKLTSAGEVCHDDSSESMSESERLAEAIRRSKLETKMTTAETTKGEANVNFNGQEKAINKLKEKKGGKQDVIKSNKNVMKTNHEHLNSRLNPPQKKSKRGSALRSSLPSMVIPRAKLDTKRSSTSHREAKSHPTLKRSASVPSKAPATLMGKIIPIQAPMIWKLVNSAQEKSNPVDFTRIQSMKSNATLKFTGEQKVLITFSQSNNNTNSTAVKTIIANVASPTKSPPKSSTGVKTRQAVLMPISVVNETNNGTCKDTNSKATSRPVRLLRSTAKVTSNMPNYSIIPLSSLISSSSAVSSIPHLFSAVQKNAVKTTLATTARQLIAIPSQSKPSVITSTSQNLAISKTTIATTTSTVLNIATTAAAAAAKVTSVTTTAVKFIVVSSLSSSFANSPVTAMPATQCIPATASISIPSSTIPVISTSATTKQAFLPQTSKTLIIKHSANSPQVFTLIPASAQQTGGPLQLIPRNQVIQSPVITTAATAKGTPQLIRPIFIAAQPSMLPPKPLPAVSNKAVSSTQTPTTQAIFIATAPINPNGAQPTSTIKLTLSPDKSIFAGAIPLIFSPQAPASSVSSLSNQLQLALSSLQAQNLVTVPTVSVQTSAVAAVPAPAQPTPNSQINDAPQAASVIVNNIASKAHEVLQSPAAGQHGLPKESAAVRRIAFPEESTSSKESREAISAEAKSSIPVIPLEKGGEVPVQSEVLNVENNAPASPFVLNPVVGVDQCMDEDNTTDNAGKEVSLLKGVLPTIIAGSKPSNVSAPPEIFEYLPTLPGACTTTVAKTRETLTVKIPLSKLVRNTKSAYASKSLTAIDKMIHSPENDLADISQIIKHTANIELALSKSKAAPTQLQNTVTTTVVSDWNNVVPTNTVLANSAIQTAQLRSLTKSAMQRYVEIRPATTPNLIASSVISRIAPSPSVINTAAVRTPIVTPAVTNSAVANSGKDQESLPISIKLASIDSGTRLRNSKPTNTAPKTQVSLRNLPGPTTQTPLLPRPTQGYLTVFAPKPVSTIAGQLPTALSNQLQRFPVTYLTTLPLQVNNQPRPQVVIQPAPRAFLSGPFQPSPQNGNTNNVRFGTQTMMIPVSLSLPGVNLQQVPVTSSILLSSLYPTVSASGLKPIQPQTRLGATAPPPGPAVSLQTANPTSKLQRLAPNPMTSLVTRPSNSIPANLVTVSGGFPIQSEQEPTAPKPPSFVQRSSQLPVTETLATLTPAATATTISPELASASLASSLVTSTAGSSVVSSHVAVSAVASSPITSYLTASSSDPVAGKEPNANEGSNSPPRDGISDLTNSLKALLNTEIKDGCTVTINIQGSPVTYALKDGKLFSMPHEMPAKKEKSTESIESDQQKVASDQKVDCMQSGSCGSPSTLAATGSEGSETITTITSSYDSPTSTAAAVAKAATTAATPVTKTASAVLARRLSDIPAPFRHLRISVPKRLLRRKIFRSESASAELTSSSASQSNEKSEAIAENPSLSMSPVVPLPTTAALPKSSSSNASTSVDALFAFTNSTTANTISDMTHSRPNTIFPLSSSTLNLADAIANPSDTTLHSSVASPSSVAIPDPSSTILHWSGTTPFSSDSALHWSGTTPISSSANQFSSSSIVHLSTANSKSCSTSLFDQSSDISQPQTSQKRVQSHRPGVNESGHDENSRKRSNPELKFGFECDFCSEKFESYNQMWRHRKLHLNDTANFSGLRRTSIPRALCPKFATCDNCSKVFQSNSDLERHKQLDNCTNNPGYSSFKDDSSKGNPGYTDFKEGSNKLNTGNPGYKEGNNGIEATTPVVNGRQTWDLSPADDVNGVNLTFDLLTDDSADVFQKDISPDMAASGNEATATANLGAFADDSFADLQKTEPSVGEILNDLTANLIGSIAPSCTDSTHFNGNDTGISNRVTDNFDVNANFDDPVFDDVIDVKPDVKPDIKPAKRIRHTPGKSALPKKRIVSRKNSHVAKTNVNQKRNKRRSRVTISDDEEAYDDGGLDLDGEFITVGKLHGEFTCSRCDLGFQNEEELDDHNETFHDSLRYNFRERRSVSNIDLDLDDFEFDFD